MLKATSEWKETIRMFLCLFFLIFALSPLKLFARVDYDYYEVWKDGCKYQVTSAYDTSTRKTTAFAELIEFNLKEGNEFKMPVTIYYTDKYNQSRSAPLKYYTESIICNCEALVSAQVNLKECYSRYNLFLSNPNLESITFEGGYCPDEPYKFVYAYKFVYDCPKLARLEGFENSVMSQTVSSKKTILMYPPAKSDVTFDLSNYGAVSEGAFKGVSNLMEFTISDSAEKEYTIHKGSLYDKDLTTLIAAVNTSDGILTIPASVKTIGIFSTAAAHLKEFKTEDGSELIVNNGVLYNSEGKLLGYPMAKPDNVFVVNGGTINEYAFYFPEHLSLLIDLTDSSKSYAKYLKAGTTLLVSERDLTSAQKYHSNTRSFSSFFIDEVCNTGSYKSKLSLPEGWSPVSIEFAEGGAINDDAKISLKGNEIEATGLWPNHVYQSILRCKDGKGNYLEVPLSFKTAEVSMEFVSSTQTTIKVNVNVGDTKIPITISNVNVRNGENTLSGLHPGTKYTLRPYAKYDNYGSYAGSELVATTKSLGLSLGSIETGPTSIKLQCGWDEGDAKIKTYTIGYDKETISSNSCYATVLGLAPESSYLFNVIVTLDDDFKTSVTNSFTTLPLEFTTLKPKCVSETCAIVAAQTNISDVEPSVGFEWKKYDAPASLPASEGYGAVCEGMLEGYIKNLQPTSFYNVRPFYKSGEGKYYYGDWITFDPSDFSYFEPTIRTYPVQDITENSATVRGYVLQGTDDIRSQGFQYWKTGGKKTKGNAPSASDITTIVATGQVMTVTLEDLEAGTDYAFRVFVETKAGYTYGDEQQFTTEGVASIVDIDDEILSPTVVGYYDMMGVRSDKPHKGLNIVVYSNGTSKKVIK